MRRRGRKGECPGGGFCVLFGVISGVILYCGLIGDVGGEEGSMGKGIVERDDVGITSGGCTGNR